MKNANSQNFKSFRRVSARFFYNKWVIVLALFSTSCSIQNQSSKDHFATVPKEFSAHFYDVADTIRNSYDATFYVRSLVKNFTEPVAVNYSKPVAVTLKDNQLFLRFEDLDKKAHVLKFYGKRHKKKFIFYTNYQTVSFPVLFIKKEMSRYTLFLSDENEIIFQNQRVNEGMVLLFGAGNTSTSDYRFKLLNHE